MDVKHHLSISIVAYDNKEENDQLIVEGKSKSKSKSEPESKSHEEIPKEIRHPSHPNHPLYLHDDFSTALCSVCGYFLKELSYECDKGECDFKLHMECASVMPSIKHEEHNHLLALIEVSKEKRACQNCRCDLNSFYARCFQCDIGYHVQCDQQGLPGTTIYEFHDHLLFLTYNIDEDKVCDVCEKEINPNIGHPQFVHDKVWQMYSCKDCGYSCHVRCVISEIKLDKREKLDHSIHEHVLFLCDEDDKDEASCCVCGNFGCVANETTFTYGCSSCLFYIHKSCIDKLPVMDIAHEFHPDHSLKLYWRNDSVYWKNDSVYWKKDSVYCDACHINISDGFTYRCIECNFNIGLKCPCASKIPSIRDKRHEHLLTFFEKMYTNKKCITKCGLCSPDAAFMRCVQCDFNVHLVCSPLPEVIIFKGHLHSLDLKDYHIEDDFGEYYCDHCEGLRDPKECAYHCCVEGCPYVVEFNCVVDEVVRSLTENHGEVGLRTINRDAGNKYYYKMVTKGLYLHDVYKSSKEEEIELKVLKSIIEPNLIRTDVHLLRIFYLLFSSEEVQRAHEKWWDSPLLPVDINSEVVKIGNYIITKDLETVFSEIHDKYSVMGDECSLSEGSKTIVLIQCVQVIQEMLQTRISNISNDVFLSWLFRMKFVQQARFKVGFVLEHMNKIGDALFDIKMGLRIHSDLISYHKNIVDMIDEIEHRKANLVKLKAQEEEDTNLKYYGYLKGDRLRLLKTLDFSCETAGKGLL